MNYIEDLIHFIRRVATSVASEISFSGGATVQRVRLQVRQVPVPTHPLRYLMFLKEKSHKI